MCTLFTLYRINLAKMYTICFFVVFDLLIAVMFNRFCSILFKNKQTKETTLNNNTSRGFWMSAIHFCAVSLWAGRTVKESNKKKLGSLVSFPAVDQHVFFFLKFFLLAYDRHHRSGRWQCVKERWKPPNCPSHVQQRALCLLTPCQSSAVCACVTVSVCFVIPTVW